MYSQGDDPLWARCKFTINTAYSTLWRRNSGGCPDRRQTDRTPHLPWQGRAHTRQSWSQTSSGVGECRHPSGWSCIPFWYTPPPGSPSRVPIDRWSVGWWCTHIWCSKSSTVSGLHGTHTAWMRTDRSESHSPCSQGVIPLWARSPKKRDNCRWFSWSVYNAINRRNIWLCASPFKIPQLCLYSREYKEVHKRIFIFCYPFNTWN